MISWNHCPYCGGKLDPRSTSCSECGTAIPTAAGDLHEATAALKTESPDGLRNALENAIGTQYDILRLLGRGGMGAVYLARETALDRLVAIKVLPPESDDSDTRERFRREAKTAANLSHPHIVPLHSFGNVEGMMYFVMGYVAGESLGDRIRRQGKLSHDVTRRIMAEMAAALGYAHKQGIVHRDIKPENILLEDETGNPMLTDFGVAKSQASASTLTGIGTTVGTPHYMSPEQASGERDLDGRSDIYSLGVVGYQMVTGRVPFEGNNIREVITQHISREPLLLATIVADVPPDLANAVERCLKKAPNERWPDALALHTALNAELGVDADVPVEFEELVGTGQWFIIGTILLFWLALYTDLFDWFGDDPWGQMFIEMFLWSFPLILPAIALLELPRRAHGLSYRRALSLIFRAPRWWPGWWPSSARDPKDLWPRLPRELRRMRTLAFTAGSVFVGIWIPPRVISELLFPMPKLTGPLGALIAGGMIVPLVGIVRWGRKRGLNWNDCMELMDKPTLGSRFWTKSEIDALLLPESEVRPPERRLESASDYERAIGKAVRALRGTARAIGDDAVSAARQAAVEIDGIDKRIQELSRDADPDEAKRIERRLEALGQQTEAERDDRREMRKLLKGQFDLANRLADEFDKTVRHRERLMNLLNTLRLQIANLRALETKDAVDSSGITGKIKAVCADIGYHISAHQELEQEIPQS